MVIITKTRIKAYTDKYPKAKDAFERWCKIAKIRDWSNFNDVKKDFNTVDYVGNGLYVFDIMGGNYRLIVRIIFRARTIFIRFIGTHSEYDKVILEDL